MTSLAWLLPAALFLGGLGLGGFFWALKNGQFDDLDGASWRAIQEDGDQTGETQPRNSERRQGDA